MRAHATTCRRAERATLNAAPLSCCIVTVSRVAALLKPLLQLPLPSHRHGRSRQGNMDGDQEAVGDIPERYLG